METQSMSVAGEDVVIRPADIGIYDLWGPGAELASAWSESGQSDYRWPTAERSCRFLGYVLEGVHVDQLQASSSEP